MRLGGLLGLKWADMDLGNARVNMRRTLTRTQKGKRFVRGEPNLHHSCATTLLTRQFTQDLLRNPLAATPWPPPSKPTPTSSPTRGTTHQSPHRRPKPTGYSKRAGERISARSLLSGVLPAKRHFFSRG